MYLETPIGSVSVEVPGVNASPLLQGWGDRDASTLTNNSFSSLIQESPTWAALPRWLLTISKRSWTSTRRGKIIWVSLCPCPATICALCREPKDHSQEFQQLGYFSLHFIFFGCTAHSMRDLSILTRDQTYTPCSRSAESFFVLFCFYLFIFLSFFFFICSEFCHTLKWKGLGFTCLPHPDPPSHLPPHPLPQGPPRAPGPSACLMHPTWAGNLFHPR